MQLLNILDEPISPIRSIPRHLYYTPSLQFIYEHNTTHNNLFIRQQLLSVDHQYSLSGLPYDSHTFRVRNSFKISIDSSGT